MKVPTLKTAVGAGFVLLLLNTGYMSEEGGGPSSPFFPSSAKTNVGGIIPSNFFMDSEACGTCHKDIFEQWNSSAHHFASFNNQFYGQDSFFIPGATHDLHADRQAFRRAAHGNGRQRGFQAG